MRDAAFVKACELVVEFRKQASHWKKLLFATSDELSAARHALFNYSLQAEEARREIERLRSEVESLRAKLASRTVEWPEWAKEGTRVRVRSTREPVTRCNYVTGEEFRISRVNVNDWEVSDAGRHWAHVGDLEPVAEHVAPPVVVATQSATQTPEETAPVVSPKVGDKVRLVREPTTVPWGPELGSVGTESKVKRMWEGKTVVVDVGGLEIGWPVSCVEVVK